MRIRSAVRENVLADPAKVPASAYYDLLSRARIWLWDEDGVRGFCAADPSNGTVWALFVDPRHEGLGIERQLLAMGSRDVWEAGWVEARLSTEVGSRAERFYAREGWQMHGVAQSGERVFIKCLGGV
jgi:GNAT superfamily N-acetyltransferase